MKHYLSGCLIIRDEAPYIQEWISFHLNQGFEHFYIYDNESKDNVKDVVSPYIEKRLVTWHDLPGMQQQRVAYNHCINNYKKETTWCAFIDTDEFLWSKKDSRFVDTLKRDYDHEGISGVAVHWLLFNSNGHEHYSPEPVTKRFTLRADSVNPHVKSVMKLSETRCMANDPHSFFATGMIVDENMMILPDRYAIISPATADKLVLNHYHTKSKEEYWKRRKNPDANSGVYKSIQDMWDAHNVGNTRDESILSRL